MTPSLQKRLRGLKDRGLPVDVRRIGPEAANEIRRLRRIERAAAALRPFMADEKMDGETEFEVAVLTLWRALDRVA